jgi:hypothetical protein
MISFKDRFYSKKFEKLDFGSVVIEFDVENYGAPSRI